ncbi:isoamyl alcohol oxidase [Penicillium freii]|uniref:Berberine/berberine-like domain-containing protein n=1 Tax=Penicillium freii TaxID=48697 RepID=A0A101MBP9_PENFR|nr:isoamyl alcohol oxidase [Penicillium freii]KUM57525.1 hypothetical protein ACN42_g9654 [Penicillium freii]
MSTWGNRRPLLWGAYPVGQLFGRRLIPRVELDERPHSLLATVRRITEETHAFLGFVALNVNQTQKGITPVQPVADNAVLPAWRQAALTVLAQSAWNYSAPRADGLSRAEGMTRVVGPALKRHAGVEPAVGSYMNEADFQLENWQVEFYWAHWDILSGVKYRWDPEGLFWALLGVGSEKWRLEKGDRMCKVAGYSVHWATFPSWSPEHICQQSSEPWSPEGRSLETTNTNPTKLLTG